MNKKFDGNLWKWLLENVVTKLLPASTSSDVGKVAKVQADGTVAWGTDEGLPIFTGTDLGKVLTVTYDDGVKVSWSNIPKENVVRIVFGSMAQNMEQGVARSLTESELNVLKAHLGSDLSSKLIRINAGTTDYSKNLIGNVNTLIGFGRNFKVYGIDSTGAVSEIAQISWTYDSGYTTIESFSVTPIAITGTTGYNFHFSIDFLSDITAMSTL